MNYRSLLPLFALTATVHAAAWPQYRGPNGDGRSPEKIAKLWTATSGPKVVWKAPSEGGFSSFAVAGNRAFTLSLKEADGAKQESLVALDAKTGKELWFAPLNFAKYDGGGDSGTDDNKGGDGPRSTPTVDADNVYTFSSQLALRAFAAASGKVLWTVDLIKEHGGRNIQWQNAASPLLEGGMLYVAGGGAGSSLLCVNAKDGSVVWKAFDEKMTHATPVPATILGQRQVIFFLQSGLLAVEPKTGKELWRYAFDYKISTAASPVVSGDIVYCSAGYGVGAGAVRITKEGAGFKASELYRARGNKPLANHWSTPVLKDGFMYGMFQFKEYGKGPVKCVDIQSGEVKWEQEGFGPGHVILAGDQVLALSDAGELVVFDAKPQGYQERARADILEGKCWTTPVLVDGRIYARSTKEAVCLDVSGK
ncbi:MAG TPA: PQQ-binding-like beta-propeller repeat protein [Chthoniobacteraceae bacterium]|jgi:outer membrane protein assembly factor BamB|nr:outer rane biosis protein [Chthoniobacter sp.]HEV7866073.1 PQQ-binding-like beta-propeller repeat protein [Chthoniobacteraceae bacterium]